jgi:hypothetical protein
MTISTVESSQIVTKENTNSTPIELRISCLKGISFSNSFVSLLVLCIVYECLGSSIEKEMRTILDKVILIHC